MKPLLYLSFIALITLLTGCAPEPTKAEYIKLKELQVKLFAAVTTDDDITAIVESAHAVAKSKKAKAVAGLIEDYRDFRLAHTDYLELVNESLSLSMQGTAIQFQRLKAIRGNGGDLESLNEKADANDKKKAEVASLLQNMESVKEQEETLSQQIKAALNYLEIAAQ